MRFCSAIAVIVVVFLGSAPVCAQAPSAEIMAAARELVAASKATDQFKNLLPLIMQQLKPVVVQGRPAVEKDYDAVVPTLLAAAFDRLDEMADLMALIYARNFSAAELRDLTAFYRTPTGQKLLQKMPTIAQESMIAGQQFAQSVGADLQKRIVDELRKRGHDVKI